MHLLAATPGTVSDGSEAVDLGQSPGEILVLSAADTELAALAWARAGFADGFPAVRLANLLYLQHHLSVDLYVENTLAPPNTSESADGAAQATGAKLVVVRLLGGLRYWSYGVEQVAAACAARGIPLALLPGDDQPDPELARLSTLPAGAAHRLWQYLVQGGAENSRQFLAYAASLTGHDLPWQEPRPLLRAGLWLPDGPATPGVGDLKAGWIEGGPVCAITFYRALVQAGTVKPVAALVAALRERGINALPVYVSSLKDPVSADTLATLFAAAPPDVILNATAFAVAKPGGDGPNGPLEAADCPVIQTVFSGGDEAAWRDGSHGLGPRDIAMNIALPEVDGRLIGRAVSFKAEARVDALTECPIVEYRPVPDRIAFTADLAAAWARLRRTPPAERRVALVLANYPNRDGRLANGVGLDTPAGCLNVLRALRDAGYATGPLPADGNALVAALAAGPTNQQTAGREIRETLPLEEYRDFFATLPASLQATVGERWGDPAADPMVVDGAFALPALRLGSVAVAVQPARGYNIDPVQSYHSPDLPPPHNYLAFHAWLRRTLDVHAVVHMGKHGNLEWLPGKALALSADCFPEAALGPLPNLYPFIVNDPGEGSQAKRRTAAVIIDHLTPPLTRAESYGPLRDLEGLVDEYYEAAGVDPRRLKLLRREILDLSRSIGLAEDLGIARGEADDTALAKLDAHLCELKEMQIRDGLHVFGDSPAGRLETDLLVALARGPRGAGQGADASLLRALAADLQLDFDPLDADMAAPWDGPSPGAWPAALSNERLALADGWRSAGDTVERLECLAAQLVGRETACDPAWSATAAVLEAVEMRFRPALASSGPAEIAGLLRGLDGRFVPPGPSGAPTRGRPEVLPTGRNFYSVDTRMVPTPAAWRLGWQSASLLVERYRQENGDWPRSIALSAWGTANMRTGGDDIAQALALMGVQPQWDTASGRVTGFEVMPLSVLDRPRVDVTLRISGFFRDAFPSQVDLVDSAARAVAALDEPDADNALAARFRADRDALTADGAAPDEAARLAGFRVFGSKPGAYGAGLQALIDERGWESADDLGRAYLAWGGYAYGSGAAGAPAQTQFAARLGGVELVLHNQDNREHDLLDSDDYYQFEGGLAAAVRHVSGRRPAIFHNDHSRPESPKIRSLEEEIARVVRARVVNPKWIAGVMRHGYKGGFEMAATVDYLFAFAATTGAVRDHHFDAVYDAYVGDAAVRDFMAENNPAALREMAERLLEAQERGLWQARSNSAAPTLRSLAAG